MNVRTRVISGLPGPALNKTLIPSSIEVVTTDNPVGPILRANTSMPDMPFVESIINTVHGQSLARIDICMDAVSCITQPYNKGDPLN